MAMPIDAVLVGAGRRAYFNFGDYAERHPEKMRYIAVAEPRRDARERFARAHGIPDELCFESWEELMARPQLAQVMVNTSIDSVHYSSTMAALERGYDVLLEKPIATTLVETVRVAQTAKELGRGVWVCHTMRYAPFYNRVRDVVQSGRLGDVAVVEHSENVSWFRMAHGFARGNWGNSRTSAPMILTKCCHDMDVLQWILGMRLERLSSFGSLLHFRPDRAPHPDVPDRCTDGCPVEDECPHYAPRVYSSDYMAPFVQNVSIDPDPSAIRRALETGPYGRCVYRLDNDVVDHQTVSMEFEGGTTVNFIMHGHSYHSSRTMRYDGTLATLTGRIIQEPEIVIYDHAPGEPSERIVPAARGSHSGGDEAMLNAFVDAIRGEGPALINSVDESLEGHMMAFAAEESRLNKGAVIEMEEFRRRAHELASSP